MSVAITTNDGRIVYLHRPDAQHVARVVAQITDGTYPAADVPRDSRRPWRGDNAAWILGRGMPGRYRNTVVHYDIKAGRWVYTEATTGRNVLADLRQRNEPALRLMVEAYLSHVVHADGRISAYEVACCDGSTIVPDIMRPCGVRIKDPCAMAHDYVFDLHHAGSAVDSFGRRWMREDADEAYCDILRAAGMPFAAARRELGLSLFSRRYWDGGTSRAGLSA
jgi:hypothetical protein